MLLGDELLVAGTRGIARLQWPEPQVLSTTEYALSRSSLIDGRLVDIDGNGQVEILRMVSGWVGPTAVYELDGSLRWKQDLPARTDTLLDLHSDGCYGVLLGRPNEPFVFLIDCRGNVLWQREWGDDQAGVAVLDVDADQIKDIVYADSQSVIICNAQGDRKRTLELPLKGYLNYFGVVDGLVGTNDARLVVGAFADGAQRWWAYSERLEVLGAIEEFFPGMRTIPIPPRELRLALIQEKEQAPLAGSAASRLSVAVLDMQSSAVFADTLSPSDELATNSHLACILLSATPLCFLVGYGSAVWKYAE